jgi:hypothetical protein
MDYSILSSQVVFKDLSGYLYNDNQQKNESGSNQDDVHFLPFSRAHCPAHSRFGYFGLQNFAIKKV